jgi:hypothetical protein
MRRFPKVPAPLKAIEAVAIETPANSATSLRVAIRLLTLTYVSPPNIMFYLS